MSTVMHCVPENRLQKVELLYKAPRRWHLSNCRDALPRFGAKLPTLNQDNKLHPPPWQTHRSSWAHPQRGESTAKSTMWLTSAPPLHPLPPRRPLPCTRCCQAVCNVRQDHECLCFSTHASGTKLRSVFSTLTRCFIHVLR